MTKEKLEELIADLGYALLFLKQVHPSRDEEFQHNRTRELISKVGDALIKESKEKKL